jgi:hypothetical protein
MFIISWTCIKLKLLTYFKAYYNNQIKQPKIGTKLEPHLEGPSQCKGLAECHHRNQYLVHLHIRI